MYEKRKDNKLRLRDLKEEADKITKNVKPIILSNKDVNIDTIKNLDKQDLDWNRRLPKEKKENLLYILPAIGMDLKIFKQIKEKSKDKNIIIISFGLTKESPYVLRQKYEEFATVFELPTFLDKKYWLGFINYIQETRDINEIYTTEEIKNILQGKFNKELSKITYNENNFLYSLAILKAKICNTLIFRGIRKIIRKLKSSIDNN